MVNDFDCIALVQSNISNADLCLGFFLLTTIVSNILGISYPLIKFLKREDDSPDIIDSGLR